jgi:RHH-type rel operon transcriptional repressor/antitoxin RelB
MNQIPKLSPDLERRIDTLTSRTGRDRDHLLKQIITEGLDDIEADLEADAVESRIESGKEATHSSAEVRRALGLED